MNISVERALRIIESLDSRTWQQAMCYMCVELLKTNFADSWNFFYELQGQAMLELDAHFDAEAERLEAMQQDAEQPPCDAEYHAAMDALLDGYAVALARRAAE